MVDLWALGMVLGMSSVDEARALFFVSSRLWRAATVEKRVERSCGFLASLTLEAVLEDKARV